MDNRKNQKYSILISLVFLITMVICSLPVAMTNTQLQAASPVVSKPGGTVSAGTQYYCESEGTLIEGFQSLTGWQKNGANTTVSLDKDHFKNGSCGIKITSSDPYPDIIKGGFIGKFKNTNRIGLWIYIPDCSKITYLTIYLSSDRSFGKHFSKAFTIDRTCRNGWNWLVVPVADFKNTNDDTFDEIAYIRLKPFIAEEVTGEIIFGGMYTDPVMKPKIVITFDDADPTVYKKAYPILHKAGIAGTFYIISSRVGKPGCVTLAQLKEMYNDGWDIANHTVDHIPLTTLTDDKIISEGRGCSEYLMAKGFTRSAYHMSYPLGGRTQHIMDLVEGFGIVTARSTIGGTLYNPNGMYDLPVTVALDKNTTVEAIHSAVDRLVVHGGTGFFYGHIIKDSSRDDFTVKTEILQELVDYASAKGIEMITISEWYKRTIDPTGEMLVNMN